MSNVRLLALAALLGVCAQGEAADIAIHGIDFGIYSLEGEGANRQARLVEKTDRIPLARGTTFGVMVEVLGKKDGRVRMLRRITRFPAPGLTNPRTGKTGRYSEAKLAVRVGDTLHGLFTFEHPWEMVPGTWTMEYWLDGERLIDKQFTVTRAHAK